MSEPAPKASVPAARSPRWARMMPGFALLRRYERSWLAPDVIAGLTVGAMLVPQAMAYAELAGMPPSTGFYAALLALVAYALVGSSRHLGIGPEPGTAILAATGVGLIAGGDVGRYAVLMAALALTVGAIALFAATARLGFLAEMLSSPVLVGYITGVGLTLLSSQLGKATAIAISAGSFFPRIAELSGKLTLIHWPTTALFAGTLALLLALRRFAPKAPGALVGVAAATAVSALLGLEAHGIRSVGHIPAGLPSLGLPSVTAHDVVQLLPTALGITLVGYADNVLTARSLAAKMGYRIDANQELAALGIVNLCSGICHGFPISSSASRTAVPASLGSKTQLVSLIAAGFVVLTLLLLSPLLSAMPEAALAAVIVSAALAIIDIAGYRRLLRISRVEFGLALLGALSVMVLDVLDGVLVAIAASVVLALARIARPHDALLAHAEALDGWVDAEQYGLAPTHVGLLVYRFDAPLFFANANRFRERLQLMIEQNPGREEWVVLDFEGIGEIDSTALEMLAELVDELSAQGIALSIARANDKAQLRLRRARLLAPVGKLRDFATINAAVKAFRERNASQRAS